MILMAVLLVLFCGIIHAGQSIKSPVTSRTKLRYPLLFFFGFFLELGEDMKNIA